MNIEVTNNKIRLFMADRLKANTSVYSPIHSHNYSEIHIITGGKLSLKTDNKEYILEGSSAVIIPAGKYHSIDTASESIKHIAFQTDLHCGGIITEKLPADFTESLFAEIGEKNFTSFINHIIFICSELVSEKIYVKNDIEDYGYEIDEFFSFNYHKDIHISDLAGELHLSQMQTQRVIKKHTGKTFGENLLIKRMTVADNLTENTGMSMLEISQYVGYSSYSGFWKAYRKYKDSFSQKQHSQN